MTEIRPGQAHVWTLPVGRDDDAGIGRLRPLLSARERDRCRRMGNGESRRQYQAAHILARLMLSRFGDVAAADWHFIDGPHGRPEPSPEINSTSLRFNLSHTRGMVACALCRQDDIGVDIEWIERTCRFTAIAGRKFAAVEAAFLAAASEEDRRRVFYSFWTLKESYIKAIGRGLGEPLDGFAFSLDPPAISFPGGGGNADCWSFDLFRPSPVHLAALSVRRQSGVPITVSRRHLDWDDLAREAGS